MKPIVYVCVAALLCTAGCASTEFRRYESRDPVVIDGKGGTKVVVDGMEIWDGGTPPRRFRVMGIIDDRRNQALVPMAQMRSDIVRKAREAGGDAVVLMNNKSEIVGYSSFGGSQVVENRRGASAFGAAFSGPDRVHSARFAVIKYIDE